MPCANASTSPASRPARSSAARTAAITPRDWSSGVLRLALEPLLGERDEARDRGAHARLLAHREVHADVVEQRAGRTLEVVAIRRQPFHGRLTGAQDRRMSIDAARGCTAGDVRRELAIDGSGELVHTT